MSDEPNIDQEEIIDPGTKAAMSPEEYAEARDKAKQHLEAELPFLRVEAEYHKLQADIEENKTRKISMLLQRNAFYAKQQQPPAEAVGPTDKQTGASVDKQSAKKKDPRKLKTD